MDILNIVLIVLIFVSLIVIIAIFGKNLKKFKQAGKSAKLRKEIGAGDVQKKGFSFGFVASKISEFFVWIAETIIKGARKVLHRAHSGIIEMKTKKNGKSFNIKDTDEELKENIEEESPKNTLVKNKSKRFFKPTNFKEDNNKKKEKDNKQDDIVKEVNLKEEFTKQDTTKEGALSDFFQKRKKGENQDSLIVEDKTKDNMSENVSENKNFIKETKEVKGKTSFFSKINPFKKEERLSEKKTLMEESFNDFSDGVKKVDEGRTQDEQDLINGVVRSRKISKKEVNDDDALGVDRKILEKKILQKIATNPRDMESYRQLGELYIKMENFDDAQSAYKFILEVSARDIDATRKLEKIKLLKRLK